jgi:DNA modification methylase
MINLFNGDMLDQLNQVADESTQLLLTDIPYNISENGANPIWNKTDESGNVVAVNTIHNQKFDKEFEQDWDSKTPKEFINDLQAWSNAWFPKIKKGGAFAIFISDRYLSHLWDALEQSGFEPKRVWTWKKPAAVPFNRKVNPVSGAEYILWGVKPKGKRIFNSDAVKGTMIERYSIADKVSNILYKHVRNDNTNNLTKCFNDALAESIKMEKQLKRTGDLIHCVIPNSITYSGGGGKKIHPTQKPVEVLKYFIELLTNPGDLVLDTFAGSGSTGVACIALDRNCVLIERDKKMFKTMSHQFATTSLFE